MDSPESASSWHLHARTLSAAFSHVVHHQHVHHYSCEPHATRGSVSLLVSDTCAENKVTDSDSTVPTMDAPRGTSLQSHRCRHLHVVTASFAVAPCRPETDRACQSFGRGGQGSGLKLVCVCNRQITRGCIERFVERSPHPDRSSDLAWAPSLDLCPAQRTRAPPDSSYLHRSYQQRYQLPHFIRACNLYTL
jgi:hypothetical protein|eukprot:COSAG02_NODE_8426_length_2575_cov_1.553312_2_plen_192_part_00